jgi:hypothetical protein
MNKYAFLLTLGYWVMFVIFFGVVSCKGLIYNTFGMLYKIKIKSTLILLLANPTLPNLTKVGIVKGNPKPSKTQLFPPGFRFGLGRPV